MRDEENKVLKCQSQGAEWICCWKNGNTEEWGQLSRTRKPLCREEGVRSGQPCPGGITEDQSWNKGVSNAEHHREHKFTELIPKILPGAAKERLESAVTQGILG